MQLGSENQSLDAKSLSEAHFSPTVAAPPSETFPIAVLPSKADMHAAEKISKRHGIDPLIARVLAARNHTAGENLAHYLNPNLDREMAKAGLPQGLDKAIDVIVQAISSRYKIAICCDYDVDGTSSAAIMGRLIRALGGRVEFFTPDRVSEGYGLNRRIVDAAIKKGCKTLLALDFGSNNHDELALARSHGLTSVVIDHHHMQSEAKPPMCDAFVNPQNKNCRFAAGSLCTAGLAYVFSARYVERFGAVEGLNMAILQALVALGTVADVVPLSGINRALVRSGIEALSDGKVVGATQLADRARIDRITSAADIGFILGPRINAAGRVGPRRVDGNGCALSAVELLMSDNRSHCYSRAQDLDSMNRMRRDLERTGLEHALEIVSRQGLTNAIVIASAAIHEGVAGIIAARLVDRFNLPAIVLSERADGSLRGSARNVRSMQPRTKSAKPLHLAEVLGKLPGKSGGHGGAAGLSLPGEKLEDFRNAFERSCQRALSQLDTTPNMSADVVASVRELRTLDESFWEQLRLLEPCDQTTNRGASFGICAGCIVALDSIDGHHTKVIIRQSDIQGDSYIALHLWHRGQIADLQPGQTLDLVCRPSRQSRKPNANQSTNDQSNTFELIAFSPSTADIID